MGRRRSDYSCPKCQRKGYLEYTKNYRRVIHYNSVTKTRTRCYIEKIINDDEIKQKTREFEKEFSKMSPTELQTRSLKLIWQRPRNRKEKNEMKAELEALEYISIKRKVPIAKYKKISAEVPPPEFQGESSLYNEIKGLAEDYLQIYKYLDKISKRIYELKPEKELSDRLAHSLSIFRKGFMDTQKTLLVPYSDKRWTADWIEWIGVHLSQLEQSKGYAGSKHAMETGEFAIWFKDGKKIPLKLKRGITSKQIKNKEPELFKMVQQMIIGIPMIEALHQGTYQSGVLVDKTKRKI